VIVRTTQSHEDDPSRVGEPISGPSAGPVDVGLFGKLPSHGDFLRRRASDAFVDGWDTWLRECLAASREALGERWLDLYLTSAAWRFALAAGACGPTPVIGVMVPSIDRVGRYFPLTVVASLPPDVNLITTVTAAEAFFRAAERLMIETLETEDVDFDRFDEQVIRLGDMLDSVALPPRLVLQPSTAEVLRDATDPWQIPIGSTSEISRMFEQLLAQRLSSTYEPLGLWWTEGSSAVEPSCLVLRGLPDPSTFVAFLDGAWAQHQWRTADTRLDTGATVEMRVEDVAPLGFRSAAASDPGRVRSINEDAFIERTEIGLWAVADGLGGHRDGEVASHMVCDALADLVPSPTFEETLEAARRQLQLVNEHLLRTGRQRGTLADRSASTVVALLVRGSRCAILWAGDSRCYRWRAGTLELLTHDHSVVDSNDGEDPAGREPSTAITRAVGVQPTLALDMLRVGVCGGDRFLLCSDGLTRTVAEAQIAACLRIVDVGAAAQGLIDITLAAGAPDNVTVLIAEAYAEPGDDTLANTLV
jgi:type VI secretion system protein ImpM